MHIPDFEKIKTYPIKDRKNKVGVDDFIRLPDLDKYGPVADLFPPVLQGNNIKKFIGLASEIHKKGGQIILMMGAHAVKNGLSPLIIQLLEKNIVTHLATNGAGAIHDFEIAFIGATSEDVATAIEDGSFGMAHETGHYLNRAYVEGMKNGLGMGAAQAGMIEKMALPYKEHSILYRAIKKGVPATVHTSIGTDIIHQHPECSGAALGETSYRDFKAFAGSISRLSGGMIINMGSAVLMPEVFLKALTVCRNLEYRVRDFAAVNIDMIDHYRPRVNVLKRPTLSGGESIFLQGHMEIILPILVCGLFQELGYRFD